MVDFAQLIGAAASSPQVQQYIAKMLAGGTRQRLGQLPAASGPRISAGAPRMQKPTNTGDVFGQLAQIALMRKMMGAQGAAAPAVAPAHDPGHEPSYRASVRETVAPTGGEGGGGESPYADKWPDASGDDDELDRLRGAAGSGITVESFGGIDPWGGDPADDGLLDRKPGAAETDGDATRVRTTPIAPTFGRDFSAIERGEMPRPLATVRAGPGGQPPWNAPELTDPRRIASHPGLFSESRPGGTGTFFGAPFAPQPIHANAPANATKLFRSPFLPATDPRAIPLDLPNSLLDSLLFR